MNAQQSFHRAIISELRTNSSRSRRMGAARGRSAFTTEDRTGTERDTTSIGAGADELRTPDVR